MRELLCFAWEGFASPVTIGLGGSLVFVRGSSSCGRAS